MHVCNGERICNDQHEGKDKCVSCKKLHQGENYDDYFYVHAFE